MFHFVFFNNSDKPLRGIRNGGDTKMGEAVRGRRTCQFHQVIKQQFDVLFLRKKDL